MKRLLSALIGIILIISGVSAHATRAGVREGVHAGFAAARGDSVHGVDILKRVVVNAASGIAAEHIGKAYTDASVDPILHKLLHGAVGGIAGGILGGKDGALSGASAAVVAETLGDLMRPTMEEAFAKIAADHPHEQDFHNHVGAYIRHQKDLILLMSVAITASLGGNVDQATFAADNALSNNWVQAALVAATAGYTVYEAYDIYKTYEAQGAEAAAKQLGLVVVETAAGAAVGTVVFKVAGVVYPTAAAALTAYKAANPGFAKAYEGVVKIAHSGVASLKAVGSLARKTATKAEIHQIYAPKYWTKKDTHTFHGQTNKVYKRDDLIDLGKVDPKGKTNLELMRRGNAPLGADNQPINLHHMIQTQDGALAEVTWSMHTKNHGKLHIWSNGSKGGVTRAEVKPVIDRPAFDKWKAEYWKARAKELGGR